MVAPNTRTAHSSASAQPNEQLDAIPMQKMSPSTLLIGIAGAVVVVALLLFFALGGKTNKAKVDEVRHAETTTTPSKSVAELKAEAEHRALTERALAAAEAKKKQQEEEAAKSAAAENPKTPPASAGAAAPVGAPGGGAAPAPKPVNAQAASKAKKDLDSLADQALQGLQ